MNIDDLLPRLEKVKKTGNGKYLACCPAHEDKSPSLAIKQTDDGKILIHCFASCSIDDIVSAIGLNLSDLMPETPQGYDRAKARTPRFNKTELFDRIAFEAIILSLALRQLLNGTTLTEADLKRVVKAECVINDIARECRR